MRRSVIVCPSDGSAGARGAIAYAAALARVRHAELHLLHVPRARPAPHRGAGQEEDVHPMIADALQSAVDAVRGRGQHVRFRVKAQRGKPESAIAAYSRRHHAGLIVIPVGYGGRRLARGSVARSLGRSAPCPVLVVTATRPGRNAAIAVAFPEVVCAMDFTKVSVSALEAAAAFAPPRGGRMTLVHAGADTSRGMVFSGSEAAQVARNQARHGAVASRRLLALVPARVSKRYRVKPIVRSGPPDRLIVDTAAEIGADLIVMGMPRRSRLDEWVGGSTSRAVLRRAKVPVLLVPA